MKNYSKKSHFVYSHEGNGLALMGLGASLPYPDAGLPSDKKKKGHVRVNIIKIKARKGGSYIRVIADDIRKRDRQAKSGQWFGKQWTNYYSQFGYDPYKAAQALHNETGLMPSNVQSEDVASDSDLPGQLRKLENHFGISVSGSGGSGGGGGGSATGGNGTSGNGSNGNSSNNTSSNSGSDSDFLPDIGGDNKLLWIGGSVAALGLLAFAFKRK